MNRSLKANVRQGAIILGGHVQSLGVLRILGREGIPCIIIDNTEKNLARRSKYCHGFWRQSDENLLEFLYKLGEGGNHKDWIIFPSNDFHVKLLCENKKELKKFFIISTDDWSNVRLFYNKKNSYELAAKLGIPIAKTWFPENERELEAIGTQFPCIIKPAVMHTFYRQVGRKVIVCRDRKEINESYLRTLQYIPADEVIVQEIIKGPSRNQFSACFFSIAGETFVHLVACRMRQHPVDYGNATTYAETVDLPILKEYGERILGAVKYTGLCEVEFKLDESDDQYKFLEINPRTWKWHSIANKAGTPFINTCYDYLLGKEIKSVRGYTHASFRHLVTDLPTQLKLLIAGFDYWNRKRKPVVYAVWAADDISPWFWEKIYLPYMIMNR